MFSHQGSQTRLGTAFNMLELIYHATVRQLRKSHGNALIGLLQNILQTVILVAVFYAMYAVFNLRGSAIRGDFMLYTLSGIFLYMTHTKAMAAVVGSEGPASPMMLHAPMNTVVAISSSALAALYIQYLSLTAVLVLYYTLVTPFVIDQPGPALAMVMIAWISGVAVGLVFLSIKPWYPSFAGIASTIYARANMIASGKMVVANALPPKMLALFAWNPLFHTIDQARGFTFINYTPHNSSLMYPIYVSLALIMIGLMGEFYTRRQASLSWFAGR